MPKIFSDENRASLRIRLLEEGFAMLKNGGLSSVNIDKLTLDAFIAKGTFYNLFDTKSEMSLYRKIYFKLLWSV